MTMALGTSFLWNSLVNYVSLRDENKFAEPFKNRCWKVNWKRVRKFTSEKPSRALVKVKFSHLTRRRFQDV